MTVEYRTIRDAAEAWVREMNAIPQGMIEKLMGRSEFKGAYNDNVFCGRWETRF